MSMSIPPGSFPESPSWTAFLVAAAGAIAEIDRMPLEDRTTDAVRRKLHWFLENPSRDLPSMMVHEELVLELILKMFDEAVNRYRDRLP